MTGMLALFFLMYSVNGGATVYYAKDILGDRNLVGTINGIFNIVQIAGMFFIAMLVKKYGKIGTSAVFCPAFLFCAVPEGLTRSFVTKKLIRNATTANSPRIQKV